MTGDSKRWSGRTTVWRDGWPNLHAPDPCRIEVELVIDGKAGSTSLVRERPPDADLDGATSHVQPRAPAPRWPHSAAGPATSTQPRQSAPRPATTGSRRGVGSQGLRTRPGRVAAFGSGKRAVTLW